MSTKPRILARNKKGKKTLLLRRYLDSKHQSWKGVQIKLPKKVTRHNLQKKYLILVRILYKESKEGNIIGVKKREKNKVNVSSPVKFKMGIRYYLKQELCRENSLIKVLAT